MGTTKGGFDLYSQGQALATSATVNGLPTGGSTIYVRLWGVIGGVWPRSLHPGLMHRVARGCKRIHPGPSPDAGSAHQPRRPRWIRFAVGDVQRGQFTILPYVLLGLPAAPGASTAANGSTLGLSVGVTGEARFDAPGLDTGLLRFHWLFGRDAAFH